MELEKQPGKAVCVFGMFGMKMFCNIFYQRGGVGCGAVVYVDPMSYDAVSGTFMVFITSIHINKKNQNISCDVIMALYRLHENGKKSWKKLQNLFLTSNVLEHPNLTGSMAKVS